MVSTMADAVTSSGTAGVARTTRHVVLMENHDAAYYAWRSAGLRDQILVHIDAHHDMFCIDEKTPITIANFICPALRNRIVREVFWIVPDPTWAFDRREITKQVLQVLRGYPERSRMKISADRITATILGRPVTIGPLAVLGGITEPVLLDIDTDYLVVPRVYQESDGQTRLPWCWPDELVSQLEALRITASFVTIPYSVEGGYTPLAYQYLGDELAMRLGRNEIGSPEGFARLRDGVVCLHAGADAEAERALAASDALLPSHPAPQYLLAQLLAKAGRQADARAAYCEARRRDPSYCTPYWNAGLAYYREGRYEEARAEYRRALVIEPHDPVAYYGLGKLAARSEDWAEAERLLRQATAIDEAFLEAHRSLGETLGRQQRHHEALNEYGLAIISVLRGRRALRGPIVTQAGGLPSDPSHGSTYVAMARSYTALGDTARALQSYRAAIACRADTEAVRFHMAGLYRPKGGVAGGNPGTGPRHPAGLVRPSRANAQRMAPTAPRSANDPRAVFSTVNATTLFSTLSDLRAVYDRRRAERAAALADAEVLLTRGDPGAAERVYRELSEREPLDAGAWAGLSNVCRGSGRKAEALAAATRALELAPQVALHHHVIAPLLADDAIGPAAAAEYMRIVFDGLATQSTPPTAWGRSGGSIDRPATLADLEATCRRLASSRRSVPDHVRLGNVLLAQRHFEAAITSYIAAFRASPHDPAVLDGLSTACRLSGNEARMAVARGLTLSGAGRYAEAVESLRPAAVSASAGPEVFAALASCHAELAAWDRAIAVLQAGVTRHPADAALRHRLATTLHAVGRTDDARTVVRQGAATVPDSLLLGWLAHLILPAVYRDPVELRRTRRRYARGLAHVVGETHLDTPDQRRAAAEALGEIDNFYLPYQGHNDRILQRRFGQWATAIMGAAFPEWSATLHTEQRPATMGRIRVGYLSAHLRSHVVGRLFLGWLQHADRSQFELYAYHVDGGSDDVTSAFAAASDTFRHLRGDVEAIAPQVARDGLDVLVYLDIGMVPLVTQLASLRLAPVQCAAWGHPVTTGLPTIDFFISSALMEPSDGARYYTERLVRLPGIGVAFERPRLPPLSRARRDFGIRDHRPIFLSCQSPYKYLPDHDALFVALAGRVPDGQFVFVAGHPSARVLEQRLRRAFASAGLDGRERCVFLPPMDRATFIQLMMLSDVFLDTVRWSGGHTALEALAVGLPIVTWPRGAMRGRHSAAFLTALGVTTTIAHNAEAYVDIAARLAADTPWRREVSAQIVEGHPHLYDDTRCVRALEAFYARAARRRTDDATPD